MQLGNLNFSASQIGYIIYLKSAQAGLTGALIALVVVVILIILGVIVLVIIMKKKRVGFFKPKSSTTIAYTAGHEVGMHNLDANGTRTYTLEARENGMDHWQNSWLYLMSNQITKPMQDLFYNCSIHLSIWISSIFVSVHVEKVEGV